MSHIIDRDVPRYTRLGNILNKNFFFLRALSHFVDQAEYDSLANAALFVSEKGGCTLPLIHAIVASEFERNVRTPGSIMRGNCVASKLMGAYSRQNGKDFMKNCVGDLVMEVVNKGSDYLLEINPSQISGEDSEEKLENNQKELQNLAELFIERIISPETLQLMPRGIRAIAGFTAEYARKYASDRLCPLVGGFLMLRLLNPALITPESLGLLPEGVRPSKESRRNLTLISKILQNLSNGILFGAKEPYMTCMNGIIEKHTESFKAFLYEVAKDEESEDEPWETFKNITPTLLQKSDFLDEQKSFLVLHSLLAMFRGRLLEGLNERVMMNNAAGKIQDYDEEEELFQLLDELPEPDLKKKNSSQEPQTEVTFLAKTLKSGQLLKKKGKFSRKEVPHRLVLTENFGHFFSSDEEKKPFQSVPVIELVTSLVDENETTFRFGFADKFFEIQCESPAEVKDWVSTIARLQSKKHNSTTEMGKRELTALERRILNHLSGVQVKYSAQSLGWEPAADETVVFIVQVRAFGSVWYLRKKWIEYLQLHDSLSSSFPHFIFPSFPPVYEEEEGMEGEGIPPPGARSPPVSSPPSTPTLSSSFPALSPRHIPSVRPTSPSSPPPSTSPSSPSTSPIASPRFGNEGEGDSAGGLIMRGDIDGQLLICMEGDVPSRGAIFGSNFLSGYLSALVQNFTIAQSSDLFDFLELSNMARVIEESSREQLQHLMRKQVDVNGMIDGMSPLHMAVNKKKVSAVRMLCDCGAIVDTRDTNRNTPLHVACQIGAVRVVKELVMIGANLEVKNKQEQTPFFVACENGHTDVVEFLMTQGVSTVVLDSKQQTAVSVATSEGHEDVVVCIAKQRKDEEWEDDASFRYQDGSTLLHMAASLGLPELFSSLLEYLNIDVNTQSHFGVTALHHAAKGGKTEVTQIILNDPSVDPSVCDDYGRTPLCLAVMEGHLEVVKLLLPVTDTTIQTNKGESLLFIAIEGGFVDIVQEILKLDPAVIKEDRNKEGEDPLTVAIQNGEVGVVRVLVKRLKGEETQGENPLYLAVLVGNEQILKILLENGADAVNFRTEEGLSLLHVACYSNSPKIATILCQVGTSTKHADLQGNTPLHLSASLSLPSLLEIFLETGGGGEGNEEGDTPVHLACLSGSLDCLKKLVQNNKNLISSTNNEGSSPLHIAVEENFVEGAIFLAENGGDVTLKNKAKQTPLSLACPALKKMLLEAAGKEEED